MAATKYSVSAYTADGVTTDYLITWDYLDNDHIAVYVDGKANYDPTSTYTFELLNSTTVRVTDEFGNAVPAGAEIEVRRETPVNTRAVTFNDGSALLAEDLNKNSDYLLYSMQEVLDTVEAAAQDGALVAQTATEALRDEVIILRDETQALTTTTSGYLSTVDADATAADNHRIAAAASEAAALASKNAAAASQAASATSEANALASKNAAAASAAAALASEQAADASEAAALVSKNAAAASATAAQNAQTGAELALDQFTDSYLGPKAADPTVDNDGNPLTAGVLFYNTTSSKLRIYDGSLWNDAGSAVNGTAERFYYTATAGQTTFNATYDSGHVDVFINGVKQTPNVDFTENAAKTAIVLATPAVSGDAVDIVGFGAFLVADTVSKANGGTFGSPITVEGDAATVLTVDRATSDGTLVDFKKDGTSVGSIGVSSGHANIGSGDTGLLFYALGDTILPWNQSGNTNRDAAIDIGGTGDRFKDLYLSGGVYLGGTGSANLLDDYEEGTWTPTFNGFTVTNAYGRYVKVGKSVTIWFNITNGTSSGSTGQGFQMYGLPFSLDTASTSRPVGSDIMFYSSGLGLNAAPAFLVSTGAYDSIRAYYTATAGYGDVTVSRHGASSYMFGQMTYPTY